MNRLFDFHEYVLVKVDEKVHMHMYILSLVASAGQENEHLCRETIPACLGHVWESQEGGVVGSGQQGVIRKVDSLNSRLFDFNGHGEG